MELGRAINLGNLLDEWFCFKSDPGTKQFAEFLRQNADRFVIAGGLTTEVFRSGRSTKIEKIKDVDVFIINDADFVNVKFAWIDFLLENSEFELEAVESFSGDVCDIRFVDCPITIQINCVCASARDASDVVLSFDRASCAFAYDARGMAITGTREAITAHREHTEPVDLVVGSGDAVTCVRLGLRDMKYREKHDIDVLWPKWTREIELALKTYALGPVVNDLIEHPPSKYGYWKREAEILAILNSAPLGLVTTVAIRKMLAPHLIGVVNTQSINSTFYAGRCDKRRHGRFVSRIFSRKFHVVGRYMPTIQVIVSDLAEWIEIAKGLAGIIGEVVRLRDEGYL